MTTHDVEQYKSMVKIIYIVESVFDIISKKWTSDMLLNFFHSIIQVKFPFHFML